MAIITVTSISNSGKGTLREAILKANSGDTIRFDSTLANKTIRLNEQLVVDRNLTIDGADAPNLTISGEKKTRILRVNYSYADVVLRNLTFANGKAVDNDSNTSLRGGAIELIDSNTLVIENSRFINNVGERGGAIFVGYGSSAKVVNSIFDGNDGTVAKDGFSAGAISTYGGGKAATVVNSNGKRNVGGGAFLEISGTTFTNNKGSYGAVYTLLTGLKVEDSVFKNNQGLRGSGAIFTDGANGTGKPDNLGGTTLIRNVIAENNLGGGDYGGAFFLSGYSKDKIIIENSKIVNNKAYRGAGLAVQSYQDEANPTSLIIRNSTIANNTSTSQGGGLWTDVKGGVTIKDSTFSANRVTNANKNGEIGGAIVLNYKTSAKSTISNSKFIDNYSDRQAGNIWIAGETQGKNLTVSNSKFAGNRSPQFNGESERTVNFKVTDGGGNVVQNIKGADNSIAGAKFVKDLQLDPVPQNGGDSGSSLGTETLVNTGNSILTEDNLNNPQPKQIPILTQDVNAIANGIINFSHVDFDADGKTDEKVLLILGDINGKASYGNSGGFYQVLDLDGTVVDIITNQLIKPGENGYETAALKQRTTQFKFAKNDGSLTAEVDEGIFLAPYAIANGNVEEFLAQNPANNQQTSGLNAYFLFGANPNEVQHFKYADNGFGFEDLYGGGDKDFDDLTFNVSVKSA